MNTTIPTTLSAAGATARPHGKVWLIGAGPGDPELLTVKAARQLQRCTIWLVDDLVSQSILELASPKTRIIHVGKRGGCVSTSQQFILRLMTRYARQGHAVARLKGGDPFIFGRGGEEMTGLNQRGIQDEEARKIVVSGTRVSVCEDLGGPRITKKIRQQEENVNNKKVNNKDTELHT